MSSSLCYVRVLGSLDPWKHPLLWTEHEGVILRCLPAHPLQKGSTGLEMLLRHHHHSTDIFLIFLPPSLLPGKMAVQWMKVLGTTFPRIPVILVPPRGLMILQPILKQALSAHPNLHLWTPGVKWRTFQTISSLTANEFRTALSLKILRVHHALKSPWLVPRILPKIPRKSDNLPQRKTVLRVPNP